jgi:acyl-CoA synthetase (NDP forming)
MNVKQKNLKQMLRPRHIVFIGSKNIIEHGVQNCKKLGFLGNVYAVNKTVLQMDGVRCYNNINELPEVPDAAFIAVRGDRTIQVIRELRLMGVAGCVCYAAGFAEIGNNQLDKELTEAAGDMALVGPNCYGIINFLDHAPLWFDRFGSEPTDKGVAIISQSGNLSFNITMNDRSLPLAYILSIGNQAVLDIADYVTVLCEDPRVTAIGLHIEGLGNMEKFMQAAKIALDKGVPIVAFKTGVSEIGSQLTMSHTSSLAGSDDLYQALFKRLNICRVDSLSAFLEMLKLFSVTGTIEGRNLGVLTVSGGESAITADIAEKNEFFLPELNDLQKQEINALMTGFEHVSNPLDYNTSLWGNKEKLEKCFTSFMQGKQFHTTLLILDYLDKEKNDVAYWETVIDALIQVRKQTGARALVISVLPEGMPDYFREKLISDGITPLQGMTDAFTAMRVVTQYEERKKHNHPISSNLLLPDHPPQKSRAMVLNEWQGKKELHSYGLTVPNGKVVSFNEEHLINEGMNGPFVVKGLSTEVVHKTDVGGVTLNLRTE